jgi:uncharacterized protein
MGLFATECSHGATARTASGPLRCLVDLDAPCNLRCTGCSRRSRGVRPALATALAMADRIAEGLEAAAPDHAVVAFYGGEPLLGQDELTAVSDRIRAGCARAGIRYEGGLVSNGTLLGWDASGALAAAGFTRALVTLAGPRLTHDARRRLPGGGGTFDRIVENLAAARTFLRVTVRFEAASARELVLLPALLRALDAAGARCGGDVAVVVHPPSSYAAQARLLLATSDRPPDDGARPPAA